VLLAPLAGLDDVGVVRLRLVPVDDVVETARERDGRPGQQRPARHEDRGEQGEGDLGPARDPGRCGQGGHRHAVIVGCRCPRREGATTQLR
jgi:hypothetical protein